MIQNRLIREIYNDIRELLKEKLSNHEYLSEIDKVIYGERVRIGNLDVPTLWIVPLSWTPNLQGGHRAVHDITYDFITLVKSYEPEEGLQKAQDLSLLVYDVLVEDRTLGGMVTDVRPITIDPAYEVGEDTQIYYSRVQFAFRLQRRE